MTDFPGMILDDSHAYRREGTGEILGECGDPADLEPRGRLQLEPGDDRARVNGHDFDVDPEIAQLGLHLSGHRLEGGGRHRRRPGRGCVKLAELRQPRTRGLEENGLPLPRHPRARLDVGQHRFDARGLVASGVSFGLRLDLVRPLTAGARDRDLAAFPPTPRHADHRGERGQGKTARRLHHGQPGYPREKRPARKQQADHDHRGPWEAERELKCLAYDGSKDSTRPYPLRKRARIAVVQGGDPARGHEHHRESDAAGQPHEGGREPFAVEKQDDPDGSKQDGKEPRHVAEQLRRTSESHAPTTPPRLATCSDPF